MSAETPRQASHNFVRNTLLKSVKRVGELLPKRADFTAMRRDPKRDVIAGITVAVVALPLALAFGAASGLGAGAGLITAIVAGFVAAFFGGSNLQVSGPTGAMAVVLLPIVADVGATAVLVVGLMAGVVLIILAIARAGRYMQFVPLPVIEGFTVGIAVIIGLQQIPSALGVSSEGSKVFSMAVNAVYQWIISPNWPPIIIAVSVTGAILIFSRVIPKLPMALLAVAVATIVVEAYGVEVNAIGELPHQISVPSLPTVPLDMLPSLVIPAIAIAALAALESLLSATVADGMTVGQRHNPNRELFGQGMANLAAPMFGGIPATAAIARTAVNVRSGARSRLGAITQSLVLLIVVLVASQWVSLIPLAALAGVLFATVISMVKVSSLRVIMKSTRADAVILVTTAVATVALDLVVAVVIGMAVAGIAALRQVAASARIDEIPLDVADHSEEETKLLREDVVAYRLDGPLFFGAAHRFLLEISEISEVKVVILRLSRVRTLDATGASVLADTIESLENRGINVLLSGISSEHESIFRSLGVFDRLAHEHHVFATTPEAIYYAHQIVAGKTRHSPRQLHQP